MRDLTRPRRGLEERNQHGYHREDRSYPSLLASSTGPTNTHFSAGTSDFLNDNLLLGDPRCSQQIRASSFTRLRNRSCIGRGDMQCGGDHYLDACSPNAAISLRSTTCCLDDDVSAYRRYNDCASAGKASARILATV